MADTTLAHVQELAKTLSSEEKQLLIRNLLQELRKQEPVYRPKIKQSKAQIQKDLDKAWGLLGDKTADEIDHELNEMRQKDWARDWPQEH